MKDYNELEKLEKLSKSLSEDGASVQKPKSKMPFIIMGAVILVVIIVGAVLVNNNKVKQEESKPDTIYDENAIVEEETTDVSSENQEENKEPEKKEPAKKAKVGDTVKAETDYGSFEVKVVSAARTNWYEDFKKPSDDGECIVIRCEVNNIDYVGQYNEGYLSGYILSANGNMTVLDEDGFKTEFFDIAGPSDGKWAVAEQTSVGEKARVSYTYIVPKGTKKVTVNVNGQYEIPLEIGNEMVE